MSSTCGGGSDTLKNGLLKKFLKEAGKNLLRVCYLNRMKST